MEHVKETGSKSEILRLGDLLEGRVGETKAARPSAVVAGEAWALSWPEPGFPAGRWELASHRARTPQGTDLGN